MPAAVVGSAGGSGGGRGCGEDLSSKFTRLGLCLLALRFEVCNHLFFVVVLFLQLLQGLLGALQLFLCCFKGCLGCFAGLLGLLCL